MVNFYNAAETREWLAKQAPDVRIVLAARRALRLLPLINTTPARRQPNFLSLAALPCFRATAVSLTIGKYKLFFEQFFAAAKAAASAPFPNMAASVVAHFAVTAAANPFASDDDGAPAAFFMTDASIPEEPSFMLAAEVDAELVEIGRNVRGTPISATELADQPLWSEGMPPATAQAWRRLRTRMIEAKEDWEVWIEWYEDRLAGRESRFNVDGAIALLPNQAWDRGPQSINSNIRALISAVHREIELPTEATLPQQIPTAANFIPTDTGVIGLAPRTPKDRLANTPEVRDFYDEVRQKLTELTSFGAQALGQWLASTTDRFEARLRPEVEQAVERQIWSSGNTLRTILAAHNAAEPSSSDRLDPGVAARLSDVVETFNQLAVADPALRQRDASRPGPREHERSVGEIRIVVEVATQAAANRAITSPDAGDELAENIETVKEPRSDLPARLAIELSRDTHRNIFSAMVVGAYRVIRALPATARGEGGFVSKEYFSGIYKAAGAGTYTAAVGTAAAAFYLRWEIVDLIISNAEVLKAYAALAFEQSPGFRQMIEWLEAHVQLDK